VRQVGVIDREKALVDLPQDLPIDGPRKVPGIRIVETGEVLRLRAVRVVNLVAVKKEQERPSLLIDPIQRQPADLGQRNLV